jgi:hypothetical protein
MHIVACMLVTRLVTMGSGFDNSIYLDLHIAELQLFVTQSYTTPGFSLVIPSPVVFCLSAVSQYLSLKPHCLFCPVS